MLLAGARKGQLLNVSGSTDVLALCMDKAKPHERLITRALGVGQKWLSVATLAAAGAALDWARARALCGLPGQGVLDHGEINGQLPFERSAI